MKSNLTLAIAVLMSVTAATAFVTVSRPTFATKDTSLSFGFLKQLGLEKPDWLPDFGGKKEDEKPEDASEEADSAAAKEGEPVEAAKE